MKISYHLGPENNKYCKITTRNDEFNYGIDGIKKGKRFEHEQRRELILHIIAQNVIRYTHLVAIAKELGKTAKKTTDSILEELEKEGFIESDKKGTSANSVKYWKIKSSEPKFAKHLKSEAKEIVKKLEEFVEKVDQSYNSMNKTNKAYAITYLFGIAHDWQPIMEIINRETKIKEEKKKFDSLLNQSYNILFKYDDRNFTDGQPLLRRLLHLNASDSLNNMNTFVKEITQ